MSNMIPSGGLQAEQYGTGQLRQLTLREQLVQKQVMLKAQLESVESGIKALDDNPKLESFMDVVQSAIYR